MIYKRVIGGKRVCGKSTELVKMSHMFDVPIMAPSYARARDLERIAREMRMSIPNVIVPCDLERTPMKGRVLVDDIEDIFSALTGMCVIMASTSMEFKEMDEVDGKK